ncbi:MAG TPA: HAD family hydrolase [Bacteroidia bacterium]|nr:HAD family hydrolase [Bacteroidia bacterium]
MIKNIIWDFDGVILDSMPVREYGFREIFKNYDLELVEKLLEYHNENGGLSRYVKIKYFYEKLLKQSISNDKIQELAENFSVIMRHELINNKYLILETLKFIKNNFKLYNFHIASGSDDLELQYLCEKLELSKYFHSINGSPVHKNILVQKILESNSYNINETILIGDSINDYEAAQKNGISFYGFNNKSLIEYSKIYIEDYEIINE